MTFYIIPGNRTHDLDIASACSTFSATVIYILMIFAKICLTFLDWCLNDVECIKNVNDAISGCYSFVNVIPQ